MGKERGTANCDFHQEMSTLETSREAVDKTTEFSKDRIIYIKETEKKTCFMDMVS